MMGRGRARRRAEAALLTDLEIALTRSPRVFSPALLWRWRYELMLAAGAAIGMVLLIHLLGPLGLVPAALLVTAIGLWPPGRRALAVCAWWIITPHRVRAGCVQARIFSRNGRLPFIVRTSLEPFGERVLIWCTAGTSAEDFEAARSILRAACWAADVRVSRSPRYAHLVTLDVIRYQPQPPSTMPS